MRIRVFQQLQHGNRGCCPECPIGWRFYESARRTKFARLRRLKWHVFSPAVTGVASEMPSKSHCMAAPLRSDSPPSQRGEFDNHHHFDNDAVLLHAPTSVIRPPSRHGRWTLMVSLHCDSRSNSRRRFRNIGDTHRRASVVA